MDCHDVRMIELAGGPRFLLEAAEPVRVPGESVGQNLHGHVAMEARVAGAVHLAHASRSDQRLDFVVSQPGAGGDLGAHGGSILDL